jgi:hypothetical protein
MDSILDEFIIKNNKRSINYDHRNRQRSFADDNRTRGQHLSSRHTCNSALVDTSGTGQIMENRESKERTLQL